MAESEIWKPVTGFEGAYEVSNLGRVRSLGFVRTVANRWGGCTTRATRGRVLKACDNGAGYLAVSLVPAPKERIAALVHRLVAAAFLVPDPDRIFVNHIDGVKTNNGAGNLEWCTRVENMRHAWNVGLCAEPATKMRVKGVSVLTGAVIEFPSQMAAEIALSETGRKSSAVHHCLVGKKLSAYGYTWSEI